jgi:uncharacterized protein (DUF885 family)
MKNYFGLFLIILAAGCAKVSPSRTSSSVDADQKFNRLAELYREGFLAWRPGVGTALGFHQYDGKITDFSRRSVDAELARLKQFESELAALDSSALSPRSSYDFRILRAAVQSERFKFEQTESYTKNPMTYADALDVNIYIKRNFAPLEERVKSIIAIESQAPAIMAAARANLNDVLPHPFVETAVDVAKGSADFLRKDLVEALKDVKDSGLQARFQDVNKRAVQEVEKYAAWLEKEKLPNANAPYALGHDKFQQMLREGELINLSPERILEVGLQELHREQQRFADAARKIDPTRKPIEVFKEIQRDHPTEASLIPETKKNLESIRQFLIDHHIITLPSDVRARVEETPQFLRATSFASMDTPGPFETRATEAYYYVTPTEKDWPAAQKEEWLTAFNYYTTDVVSIHEAYPGHYVQFLCLNASPANKLEKIFSNSYAFVEGWAHYTEQMMLDEGFGANSFQSQTDLVRAAKYRMAQSDEALLRLCRLCVSIKTHCQGMSVDDATKFFEENCYYEHKPARQEALRGTFDPGYLFYTLGKLEILKLRQDFQREQGTRYSLQKFHNEMLRHGAPPIRLLREVMLKDRNSWDEVF